MRMVMMSDTGAIKCAWLNQSLFVAEGRLISASDTRARHLPAYYFVRVYRKPRIPESLRRWASTAEPGRCRRREPVRIVFSDDGTMQTITWDWRPRDDEGWTSCDRTNMCID